MKICLSVSSPPGATCTAPQSPPTSVPGWLFTPARFMLVLKLFGWGKNVFFSTTNTWLFWGWGVSSYPQHTHSFVSRFGVIPRDAAQPSLQGGALLVWLPLSQSTWQPEALQSPREAAGMGCRGVQQQSCPSLRPPVSPLSFVLTSASTDAPKFVLA